MTTDITSELNSTTYAAVQEELPTLQPRMYYFTAYQFRLDGAWYATNIYPDKEDARKAASDKAIVRRKTCAIWL